MADSAQPPQQVELAPATSMTSLAEDSKLLNEKENTGKAYPKSVFFIIGNEFCERFSYYGMRAILVLYLTTWLGFSGSAATGIYHTFVMICYFMPILGAILADGYIGKYKTILYLSLVYASGNILMTLTALPPPEAAGPIIGLILIGVGTGGIKPCVSAFGGDQFSNEQEKARDQFFSIFYFCINIGSFLSMIVTPVIRERIQCFGSSCYPVAFGIPAILMLFSLALFLLGTKFYRIVPPEGSVIRNFTFCIASAIQQRCRKGRMDKEHWLDYADEKYDRAFLEEVKVVLRLFVLFVPLPVFWALFDQQGSRWTLQAIQLDRHLSGDAFIPADQIQAINPILILLLIPLFDFVVYPLLDMCHVPNRPLQRMVAGMSLAALSFVIAAVLQIKIDASSSYSAVPKGESTVFFINSSPCTLYYESDAFNETLSPHSQSQIRFVSGGYHNVTVSSPGGSCGAVGGGVFFPFPRLSLVDQQQYFVISANQGGQLLSLQLNNPKAKPEVLQGSLVGLIGVGSEFSSNRSVWMSSKSRAYNFGVVDMGAPAYVELAPGSYYATIDLDNSPGSADEDIHQSEPFLAYNRGVYTLVIQPFDNGSGLVLRTYENVAPNSVSVWWQLPQYFVISTGEVLFAVTGLRFAYSQAPNSMKSVVQAGWLLTTAFGNLIDVIVAGCHMSSQFVCCMKCNADGSPPAGIAFYAADKLKKLAEKVGEFFFFSALMLVTTIIFAIMANFYTYVTPSTPRVVAGGGAR